MVRHHHRTANIRRAIRMSGLLSILSTCVVLPGCGNHTDSAGALGDATNPASQSSSGVPPGVERPPLPKHHPLPTEPRRAVARAPEPAAEEARAKIIHRDADAIRGQCKRAADGNWERWQRDTEPYRADLRAKLDMLKTPGLAPAPWREALEGRHGFPLFEVAPRDYLKYLYEPESLDGFRRDRAVVAAHRWLRDRGIDLIFVPVPKMTEVYVERFLDPYPPDGIIAPQVRHALLELLDDGVEVVDALPLLRSLRDSDSEYLYNTADSHWAPRAMRIIAKEVADRIARYKFGAESRSASPIVKAVPGPYHIHGPQTGDGTTVQDGLPALNAEQKQRASAAQTKNHLQVTLPDGRVPTDDPGSPVLLIGNSYVINFREQLIRELNLLIRTNSGGGQTTESFADFLREPERLDNCRVIVWITTGQHLTEFKPLPPTIAESAYRER
jgi:hypothetical protein